MATDSLVTARSSGSRLWTLAFILVPLRVTRLPRRDLRSRRDAGAVAADCPIADRRCRRWTPAMPRRGLRRHRRRLPVPRTGRTLKQPGSRVGDLSSRPDPAEPRGAAFDLRRASSSVPARPSFARKARVQLLTWGAECSSRSGRARCSFEDVRSAFAFSDHEPCELSLSHGDGVCALVREAVA